MCALLSAALRASRMRVGTYTSPHLVDVRERIMVDERPITEPAFAAWTTVLRDAIVAHQASFFEATTVIALADFAARGVDVAVVEVGLGGRLDSTNVLRPVVSGITQIDLDHTEYLGQSLPAVAREKAGIAKRGIPFVVGEPSRGVAEVLAEAGREAGATVQTVPADAMYRGVLGMVGDHQRRNAAVAEAILHALPDGMQPSVAAMAHGFASVRVAGRFDRRGKWIFDVAHNPGAMTALLHTLESCQPKRPVHALVGVLNDKPWDLLVNAIVSAAERIWLVQPPSAPPDRRWDLSSVTRLAGEKAVVAPDFDSALQDVQVGAGTVLVTGSFHTVGDALARLPGLAPLG